MGRWCLLKVIDADKIEELDLCFLEVRGEGKGFLVWRS